VRCPVNTVALCPGLVRKLLTRLAPVATQRAGLMNLSCNLHDADGKPGLVEKTTASAGG